MEPTSTLPVLDIGGFRADPSSPAAHDFAHELREALAGTGFCYIGGHGVDDDLGARLQGEARQFFALPEAERLAIHNVNSPQFRGYTQLGTEHTGGAPDRRDQLDVGREQPRRELGPDEPAWLRLQGPNLWPDAVPGLRHATLAWMDEMESLGSDVARAVALGLGLAPDHFAGVLDPSPEVRVKIIRYPGAPEGTPSRQGVGAHRDNGLLTLLFQDDTGGLQVERGGVFVDATPIPGTFVLNIGEMLQLATHGLLRATVHRVRSPAAGSERLSIAYFFNPRLDAVLAPVELPPDLAARAPGGESTDPSNPILARYGDNALKVRLRSHPDVAARHHGDLSDRLAPRDAPHRPTPPTAQPTDRLAPPDDPH